MNKILLIGPAGAGKTHRLLDDFVRTLRESPDPLAEDFFFILPTAEHAERILSLLVQRGIKGFFHRRVTTLTRLIPSLFGIGEHRVASNVTRFLMLREILGRGSWGPFFHSSHGLVQLLLGFLNELKESLIPVSEFRERMNRLKQTQPDGAFKYEALAAIYEAYEGALAAQGLRDPQDAIWIYRAWKLSGKIRPARLRKIWIDGFFDFSALQREYIRELAALADEATVALTKDPAASRAPLFEGIQATEDALLAMGFRRQVLSGPHRWEQGSPLAYLEGHLFDSKPPRPKSAAGDSLQIFRAVGVEGEVEMIARQIRELYQTGDYRFSDFAVLLRRVGEYGDVVRAVFRRDEIPFEIHERERLKFSPLAQAVVALLRIFTRGWRREDLLAWLKSSYVRSLGLEPHSYAWVGGLERWALRQGMPGGREAWLAAPGGQRLGPLAGLEDALRSAANITDFRTALRGALETTFQITKPPREISGFAKGDAAAIGRLEALFDEIEASFASSHTVLNLETFAERFFHLVDLDLYSLHHRDANRVQVYDISLARQKEYRVVFLAGLVEKGFPLQIKEDPVLSDWERELFNGSGEGPLLQKRLPRQSLERYLFYLAVTRARERLYLSHPVVDLEGHESLASYYLEELESLFEGGVASKSQHLAHPYPAVQDAASWRELETAVMGELWNPGGREEASQPLLLYLTNRLLERGESRGRILKSFHEIRGEITDPRIRESPFFQVQQLSPTALEMYAKCPYRFFSSRVLKLTEPEDSQRVRTLGRMRHEVLEEFMKEWKSDGFKEVSPGAIRRFVGAALDRLWEGSPIAVEKKYQLDLERLRMEEDLERFLEGEVEDVKESPLRPRDLESPFGPPESVHPPLEIGEGAEKIGLRGRMDRVDVDEKGEMGLVIDYKSSRQSLYKDKDLLLGTHLQLPIYLLVLEKLLGLKPVGGELRAIRGGNVRGIYHQDHLNASGYKTRSEKRLAREVFQAFLGQIEDYVKRYVRGIRSAVIEVKPRDCVDYCPFGPVCRIEKWRLPLILEQIKKEEGLHAMASSARETGS